MGCVSSRDASMGEESREEYVVVPPSQGAAGQSVYNEPTGNKEEGAGPTAGRSVYGQDQYKSYMEVEFKVETTRSINVKTMAEELSYRVTEVRSVHEKLPWVFDSVLDEVNKNLYKTLYDEGRFTSRGLTYGREGLKVSTGLAKGMKAVNQDSILAWTDYHKAIDLAHPHEIHIFAVFDGHGPKGHNISQIARDMFPLVLAHELHSSTPRIAEIPNDSHDDNESIPSTFEDYAWDLILPEVIAKVDDIFKHEYFQHPRPEIMNVDARCSGSTAAIVLVEGRKLILASLGDSSTLLIKVKGKGSSGRYSCISHRILAKLHKPDDPIERHRIQATGGIVDNAPNEPTIERLWPPSFADAFNGKGVLEAPGVAISRALGDVVLKKYGMSNVPTVKVEQLDHNSDENEGYIVVVGTDGLWDVITVEEVVYKVTKCGKDNVAEHLVEIAQGRWHSRCGGLMADDIGVVCAHLS